MRFLFKRAESNERANYVLPPFDPTLPYYSLGTPPSNEPLQPSKFTNFMSSLAKWLRPQPSDPAVNEAPFTPQVKVPTRKMVVIGIHGWFPTAKLVQTVFGERTGTSDKFCKEMAEAIEISDENVEVTCIPLSGDGKVGKRVDLYDSILMDPQNDYVLKIREADEVFFVVHSQGTIVGVCLVARLIQRGLLEPRQKIGMLAMAGITHGPFRSIKGSVIIQYVETDAARELFDFCYGGELKRADDDEEATFDVELEVVRRFWDDVKFVLDKGLRLTCIASWMDQVVPLYSGLMYAFDHPNILRAVYVDHYNYRDDFLLRLVSFCIKLRNLGLDDHRLLVDLSEVLAGSLYQGTEHSNIFEEPEVYRTAYNWFQYQSTSPPNRGYQVRPFRCTTRVNPYRLPWSMRSLYASEGIQGSSQLKKELEELRQAFVEWTPIARPFKEIKYRLAPLRTSKL